MEKIHSTVLEQIITSIQNFEPSHLHLLLDSNKTYQDLSLPKFIDLVEAKLDGFKKQGETQLTVSTNLCNSCNCNQPIFVFKGKWTDKEYGLFFKFQGEEIVDIYECTWYGDQTIWDNF